MRLLAGFFLTGTLAAGLPQQEFEHPQNDAHANPSLRRRTEDASKRGSAPSSPTWSSASSFLRDILLDSPIRSHDSGPSSGTRRSPEHHTHFATKSADTHDEEVDSHASSSSKAPTKRRKAPNNSKFDADEKRRRHSESKQRSRMRAAGIFVPPDLPLDVKIERPRQANKKRLETLALQSVATPPKMAGQLSAQGRDKSATHITFDAEERKRRVVESNRRTRMRAHGIPVPAAPGYESRVKNRAPRDANPHPHT